VLYDDNVRAFYRRLASELPTAEERTDFETQVASAELARKGETHDTFRFPWPYPDELRISVDIIDAIYADEDGADVNVIVHLVGGLLSWAERFRNDSNPIMIWPPPKDAPLRFPRYNP